MKKFLLVLALLIAVAAFVITQDNKTITVDDIEIIPVSHATAVLNWGGKTIYADPVGGTEVFQDYNAPDVIFITHHHGDHFNLETIEGIITDETALIVPASVAERLSEGLAETAIVLANGESFIYENLTIEAVPSYNVREEALQNHPEGRDNGYILSSNNIRVYFSGDSEDTPEMRMLENIDMAFVAMNLPYTMDVDKAADAVLEFKPKRVYPYHYRTPDGFSDVARFKELVNAGDPAIEVVQLDWYK